MKKKLPSRDQLEKMVDQCDFSELHTLSDQRRWKSMEAEDRELLARLFVMSGEQQLREAQKEAMTSFEKAAKLAPSSTEILKAIGKAYLQQGKNVRCLALAIASFQKMTEINPDSAEAWLFWGQALVSSGSFHGQSSDIQEAEEKLERAASLAEEKSLKREIFWRWGQAWSHLGEASGEALDLRTAIQKFTEAKKLGLAVSGFWLDIGNAHEKLARLIGRPEMAEEAISYFEKGLETAPNSPLLLDAFAQALRRLYEVTQSPECCQRANQAFEALIASDPSLSQSWFGWGDVLLLYGKIHRDVQVLTGAAEKFERAGQLSESDPIQLRRWAETLVLWGSHTDRLDLLKQAEEKILEALELEPDAANSWYIYGCCLTELGRYFKDSAYLSSAIEKFHYGLSLDSRSILLWYGLALAHFAMGEQQNSPKLVEQSAQYCARVIELGGERVGHYWNDWGTACLKLAELTGDHDVVEEAVEKFERALKCTPEGQEPDPDFLYNYGCALEFLGDCSDDEKAYEKAITTLKSVIENHPDYHFAIYNLAATIGHLAELTADVELFQEALSYFEQMDESFDEDEGLYNEWGITLLNLAQLANDPHRPEQSEEYFKAAESKFMHGVTLGSTHAFYNLACLYSLVGHLDMSMHFLERAAKAEALPAEDDIMNDEWLDSVRQTDVFREFMSNIFSP